MVAALLEAMLESLGADVIGPVTKVEKIVGAARDDRPDAITLDVNLDGDFVYRAVPRLQELGIPFVFVSAYVELPRCPPNLQLAPRIQKPFNVRELADVLTKAIGDHSDP